MSKVGLGMDSNKYAKGLGLRAKIQGPKVLIPVVTLAREQLVPSGQLAIPGLVSNPPLTTDHIVRTGLDWEGGHASIELA